MAGEIARAEHGQHMPLDAEGGIVLAKTATDDCQRRSRHQQAHQGIGAHRADDRHDEARLARDLAQAAAAGLLGLRRRRTGLAGEQRQDEDRRQGQNADGEEAAGKGDRRKQVAGEDHRLRADHRGGDAAGQHPGDRLGAEGRAADVGGGEAVLLGEGGRGTDDQEPEGEQGEGPGEDRRAGDEPAEDRD